MSPIEYSIFNLQWIGLGKIVKVSFKSSDWLVVTSSVPHLLKITNANTKKEHLSNVIHNLWQLWNKLGIIIGLLSVEQNNCPSYSHNAHHEFEYGQEYLPAFVLTAACMDQCDKSQG